MKILCLGNEFIKEDSLAKKVGKLLEKKGYKIINIENGFEILNYSDEKNDFIILDVVKNLDSVKLLDVRDLKENKVVSAHDFDAGFFLQLINSKIKIIGIPMKGNIEEISLLVQSHLTFKK